MLKKLQDLCLRLDGERPAAGILICDQLLDEGVAGRLKAIALRYRASFMLQAHEAWAPEAIGYLQVALPLTQRYPADRAHVLHLFVSAYSMFGSPEMARPYADQYFKLAEGAAPAVRHWLPKVWFNLGFCYAGVREWTQAESAYRLAMETTNCSLTPFSPGVPAHNLALVLLEQGRRVEARDMLTFAQANLDEQYALNAMDQEARFLLAAGELAAAQDLCQKVLADPGCPNIIRAETLGTLAEIEYEEGNYATADELVERALDVAIRIPSLTIASTLSALKCAFSRKEAPKRHA